jgi:hypothetical protein
MAGRDFAAPSRTVIHGDHHLFGIEVELTRDLLQRVYRRPVDIGLASLT